MPKQVGERTGGDLQGSQPHAPAHADVDAVGQSLSQLKDVVSIVQGIATSAAIVAAGYWWFFQGEPIPRATLSIVTTDVSISPAQTLFIASIKIENVGRKPLRIDRGNVVVSQVFPINNVPSEKMDASGNPLHVLDWAVLQKSKVPYAMELAPGEKDSYFLEFLIPASAREVRVYADAADSSRSGLWSAVAFRRIERAAF